MHDRDSETPNAVLFTARYTGCKPNYNYPFDSDPQQQKMLLIMVWLIPILGFYADVKWNGGDIFKVSTPNQRKWVGYLVACPFIGFLFMWLILIELCIDVILLKCRKCKKRVK